MRSIFLFVATAWRRGGWQKGWRRTRPEWRWCRRSQRQLAKLKRARGATFVLTAWRFKVGTLTWGLVVWLVLVAANRVVASESADLERPEMPSVVLAVEACKKTYILWHGLRWWLFSLHLVDNVVTSQVMEMSGNKSEQILQFGTMSGGLAHLP